jgi:hypothetical protein
MNNIRPKSQEIAIRIQIYYLVYSVIFIWEIIAKTPFLTFVNFKNFGSWCEECGVGGDPHDFVALTFFTVL